MRIKINFLNQINGARLFTFQIGDISLSQSERQIEDNLTKDCVTYFCPGHLNKFKDRKAHFTTKTITYLTFSPDGSELLVNMGSEQIYLYDLYNAQEPVVSIEHICYIKLNSPIERKQFNFDSFVVFEHAAILQAGEHR